MNDDVDPSNGPMDGVLRCVGDVVGHLDAEAALHLEDHVGEGLGP